MPNPSTLAADEEQIGPTNAKERMFAAIAKQMGQGVDVLAAPLVSQYVEEVEEKFKALSTSLAILGEQKLAAEQSRDRVLAANCEMTQKLRDLSAIARAADRASNARIAFDAAEQAVLFDGAGKVPDSVTHEAADSDAELEMLLQQHAHLFRR